jgi:hypothetical protein
MRRKWCLLSFCAFLVTGVSGLWMAHPTPAEQPRQIDGQARQPKAVLPVTQVILFNSGVGYFQREGEVEADARIDLTFPATDVNDLLKSLVLDDKGNSGVSSISYDSQDPIEKTLKSFALDLTANPTFGQILNQARGEKIEVTQIEAGAPRPTTLVGAIVGMESETHQIKDEMTETHLLNLLTSEGMRSVPLAKIDRVRFLNPVLESELGRALAVLAGTHDAQKKTISLNFAGKGKEHVRVGYVVENPIWKTSYRLVLGADGKPKLQGWAVVENSTDEDWKDIRMVLVSGRPISYQMNLYQPLYIPRPTIEPDLFASLRPPTYNGALANVTPASGSVANTVNPYTNPAFNFGAGNNGQNYNRYQGQFGNLGSNLGIQGGQTGMQGGQIGGGLQGFQMAVPPLGQNGLGNTANVDNNRLSFEELQKRRQALQENKAKARNLGSVLASPDAQSPIASVASAEEIGDAFLYNIEQKVNLNRQKSALLPIISKGVEASKVSIFNESVHAKFPLLGLKFKNTSGQNLMQGPITIYEGDNYAGDGRMMDLQPNEERLLSYAVDLGTEVKAEGKAQPSHITTIKIAKGLLHITHKQRETRTYLVKNRSPQDRVLLIEHPYRTDWKLIAPEKPIERSRDVYRFEIDVKAGASMRQEVVEEQVRLVQSELTNADDKTVRLLILNTAATQPMKEALSKAVDLRSKLVETQRELAQLEQQLKEIVEDQTRLRANLREMPPTSTAYKRYLEKFDTQETEIERLRTLTKQLRESEKQQKSAYENYVANLNVE